MFYPKKSLGQNFLIDQNIAKKIIGLLSLSSGDKVLEIGPGQGALTKYLNKNDIKLILIEKDKDLAISLKKEWPHLDILLMDALTFPWDKITGKLNKIIGNLPYNIASTLIWEICAHCFNIDLMVFTIQKEVAEKIGAKVGEKKYGPLSIWVQTFCEVKLEFSISPTCFNPRPKVMSQVITLRPRNITLDNVTKKKLSRTLKLCFKTPRKQLGNILKKAWNPVIDKYLQKHSLKKEMRPQMLSPKNYLDLSKIINFSLENKG